MNHEARSAPISTGEEPEHECAWCGSGEPDIRYRNPRWYPNRRGEVFCSPSHRSSSNRALRRFLAKEADHG